MQIAILGGGPAGLMAAEVLSRAGLQVDLYDAMPSVGRKFLLAGIGGLNLTHSEDYAHFRTRYASSAAPVDGLGHPSAAGDPAAGALSAPGIRDGETAALQAILDDLPPSALCDWVHGLGITTFVGTSGRVFPTGMKAAPLLRAWLRRLRDAGVRLHVRHRWLGWTDDGALQIAHPGGLLTLRPAATLLALGGASWPQLGSDGAWVAPLQARGVAVAPLQSANCGFQVAWSDHLRSRFAGAPLKNVALTFTDRHGHTERRQGELIVAADGVEGSLVYAFARRLREQVQAQGSATVSLDLLPGHPAARVLAAVAHPRGARSLSSHLQSRLGLTGVKVALLHEVLDRPRLADPALLAAAIKALPLTIGAAQPLAGAISTAGGVCFSQLDARLMMRTLPGTFVAGEMLDWEAPTGGYLLTACFATGLRAGSGIAAWLREQDGGANGTAR